MAKRRKRRASSWWFVYRHEEANLTCPWGCSVIRVDAVQAQAQVEAALHAMDRNPTRKWQRLTVRKARDCEYGTALAARTERDLQVIELMRIVRSIDPAQPL